MDNRLFNLRRGRFFAMLAVIAFSSVSVGFAQYSCSVTYREANGNLHNYPAATFASPQQCQAMTNAAAAQARMTSLGCRCQSLQPQPVNNPSSSVAPVPTGPTPEELRKAEEERAAAAEAQKKAAFIRDRDSTELRDAVGSGSSGGIRDSDSTTSGSSGENRESNGSNSSSTDIREAAPATAGKSETLGALKKMAASESDADCRYDKGGCPAAGTALIPWKAMTPLTRELLLHIPQEAQKKQGVIDKINKFDNTEEDRNKKQRKLTAAEKQIAAGAVVDMTDAKNKVALLKEQIASDTQIENKTKQDLKGDPEVGWIETPAPALSNNTPAPPAH